MLYCIIYFLNIWILYMPKLEEKIYQRKIKTTLLCLLGKRWVTGGRGRKLPGTRFLDSRQRFQGGFAEAPVRQHEPQDPRVQRGKGWRVALNKISALHHRQPEGLVGGRIVREGARKLAVLLAPPSNGVGAVAPDIVDQGGVRGHEPRHRATIHPRSYQRHLDAGALQIAS